MKPRVDFSFDERVVALYNKARAHPPDVSKEIGQAITKEVHNNKRVLEIGVGTGRIALPVAQAGCDVIGFDLSPHMLGEFLSPDSNSGSLSVLQSDMHTMPFESKSFDAVLAVHVLHLAKDWQQVIREAARVLKSGGAFIQGDDWIDPHSVVGRLRDELRMHAVRLNPNLMPPAAGISKADFMATLGGTEVTEYIAAEWTTYMSPNDRIAVVEQRIDAESWILTDDEFEKMLIHLREFAANIWDDLDEKQPVTRRFKLKITRGDW